MDVAVVVGVGEEALERVAHEHAQRLRPHARTVARQLDRLRRPRHQAVADDADATVGPHCLTERTVVEHRRDRQPAVAKHTRMQLRRARQAVVKERLELRDDLLDGTVVHGDVLAEDGVDARERRHGGRGRAVGQPRWGGLRRGRPPTPSAIATSHVTSFKPACCEFLWVWAPVEAKASGRERSRLECRTCVCF